MVLVTGLLEIQKEAVPFGLATSANVYNTLDRMVELGNIGETQTFFTDPATIPPKQPEGPSMAEQLAMIDLQNRKEESMANLQMKSNEMQMKAQQSATEAQAQMSAEMQKMQMALMILMILIII